MSEHDVEWPDPQDDPDEEPTEPWAKNGDHEPDTETDPEP